MSEATSLHLFCIIDDARSINAAAGNNKMNNVLDIII